MKIPFSFIDLLRVSPLIVLFLVSLIPITLKVFNGNKEPDRRLTLVWGLLGILSSMFLLVFFSGTSGSAFSDSMMFDGTTLWAGLIGLMAVAVSMILMFENPSTVGNQFSELMFLTLSSATGMLILVAATDLLVVFVGLEAMSLPLYLMIGMSNEQRLSKESALKYFVLGSFASAIFLYGIALVFGSAGTTNILQLKDLAGELMDSHKMFLFGITMLIIGFCFKVSIAPFHAWTPDVYEGAPTPHTAFMATAVKAISFAAFLRTIGVHTLGPDASNNLFVVLQVLAMATMLVGNGAAILQDNLKRMIAYSSIAHSGYLLVGVIAAGVSAKGSFGASGVIFYLFAYSLMTLGALAVLSMLEQSENSTISVEDLGGLSRKHPVLSVALVIFLLSLAGIPPTLGFFGKFYLFTAALEEGLVPLTIWAVINSVISVFYYLRPIVVMYMKEGSAQMPRPMGATGLLTVILAALIVILGFVSGPIFEAVERSLF
ncbi:MAG TPA: NADH-quinone oxidoreductase subunit N [Pseudobdellovibrionaceae bacterium]|nr:NADH-quinone oxidoreductase subunit N [Pseudobdellovibrionaceae bacterium]